MIELGILSHDKLLATTISAAFPSKLVAARQQRQVQEKSLWCFVNCQIACQNPKLYHYVQLYGAQNVAVLVIELPEKCNNWMLALGDACMEETSIVPFDLNVFAQVQKDVQDWTQQDASHCKAMAEVLIADLVPSDWIKRVLVHSKSEWIHSREQICNPQVFFDYCSPAPYSQSKLLHNCCSKIVILSDSSLQQAECQQLVQQEATTEHAKLFDLPQMHTKSVIVVPLCENAQTFCQQDTLVLVNLTK